MALLMKEFAPGEMARVSWHGMQPEIVRVITRCEVPCSVDGLPRYRCESPAGVVTDFCSSVMFDL
jgi:hypothetical protein